MNWITTIIMVFSLVAECYSQDLFRAPVKYPIIYERYNVDCSFGSENCARVGEKHNGVDYDPLENDPLRNNDSIFAANSGRIVFVNNNCLTPTSSSSPSAKCFHGLGNIVIIEHSLSTGNRLLTQYCHIKPETMMFEFNDIVHKGEYLGLLGETGGPYDPPHLHFEVKQSIDHQIDGWGGTINGWKTGDYYRMITNTGGDWISDSQYGGCLRQDSDGNLIGCAGYSSASNDLNILGFLDPEIVIDNPIYRSLPPLQIFGDLEDYSLSTFNFDIQTNFTGSFEDNGEWEGVIYIEGWNNGTWTNTISIVEFANIHNSTHSEVEKEALEGGKLYEIENVPKTTLQPYDEIRVSFTNGAGVNENRNLRQYLKVVPCRTDKFAPNNNFKNAYVIYPAFESKPISWESGGIASTYDQDLFRIYVAYPGVAAAVFTHKTGDLDITWYDSDGTKLKSNSLVAKDHLVKLRCFEEGLYYIRISPTDQSTECIDYTLGLGWAPGIETCKTFTSSAREDHSRNLSCVDCPAIDMRTPSIAPVFDGSTYKIETHLIGFDESQYYNVYAVDQNGLVGTPVGNVTAVSTTSLPPNIVVNDIPCGSNIILRVEHVDNPDDCFKEIFLEIPTCQTENRSINFTWPSSTGQCFLAGQNVTASWNSTNVDKVHIYLKPIGSSHFPVTLNHLNQRSTSFDLPTVTGDYQLLIVDADNGLVHDASYIFEIDDDCQIDECAPPAVTINRPNDQQHFIIGENLNLNYSTNVTQSCQFREYELEFSIAAHFPTSASNSITTEKSDLNIPFYSTGTFFWRVRSINLFGETGNWSEVRSFILESNLPDYEFLGATTCTGVFSDGCHNSVTSFDPNQTVYVSCGVRNIRAPFRIRYDWRSSGGDLLYSFRTQEFDYNEDDTHYLYNSYTPSTGGSYTVDVVIESGGGETIEATKSFSVTDLGAAPAFGNLSLVNAYSSGAVNGVVQVQQGNGFSVTVEAEYTGNLSQFPNRTLEPVVGCFLKKVPSTNITTSWNVLIGEHNMRFRCPTSTSICDGTWDDIDSETFFIDYNIEPGHYYLLCYIDYRDDWMETNENASDQRQYIEVEVLPNCRDIKPILESNITSSSVDLSWDQQDNVISTYLRYRKAGEADWVIVNFFGNGATLGNLEACTPYESQLLSYCTGESIRWSTINTFTTQCEVPCLPPDGRADLSGLTSAQVYWQELDPVYLYEVQWRELGQVTWISEGLENSTFENISGLAAGKQYEWQIRSKCPADIYSNWSSSRLFITDSDCNDGIMNGLETGIDCGGLCAPCDCTQLYHVVDYIVDENTSIHVKNSIELSKLVLPNLQVKFEAGKQIEIHPGFEVGTGSILLADIRNCDN